MNFAISTDDVGLLAPLLLQSGLESKDLKYDGVGILTIPDEIAPRALEIISGDWRPRGLSFHLKNYASMVRYAVETRGITIDDVFVATDRETQKRLLMVREHATNGGYAWWKNPDGSFSRWNSELIVAILAKVAAHVQACYAMEASVVTEISLGHITSTAQIDAVFAKIT